VLRSRWQDVQPRAREQNAFLKKHSWEEYAAWHLGLTEGADEEAKARYAFVYGDFRRLHRMGLIACHYRAAEWRHKEVELAAHELLAEETPGRNAGLEAHVLDWIDDVRSSDFMVHVEFLSVGRDQPSRQRIQQPLEEWLSTLDVDALFAVRAERGIHALPPMRLRPRDGWEILVHPIPASPEHRRPRDRLIGIGPTSGGWVIDESRIADGLRAKGKRLTSVGIRSS